MKCPKCGYISFDHNQVCPKCKRDISQEQAKLNILPFPPNPPALLGILIGEETSASNIGLGLGTSGVMEEAMPEDMMGLADDEEFGATGAIEEQEIAFDGLDESALSEEESLGDFDLDSDAAGEISFEEELVVEEPETEPPPLPSEDEAEELSLDLGDLEEKEEEIELPDEFAGIGAEDLTLELSKESLDASGGQDDDEIRDITGAEAVSDLDDLDIGEEEVDELSGFDLDMIDTGIEETGADTDSEPSTILENLEESEFDLTGLDVQIETPQEPFDFQEMEISAEEISLEEISSGDGAGVSDSSTVEAGAGIDLDALDALDLELQDTEKAPEESEIELSLEDLKVNETGELEIGALSKAPDGKDKGALGELPPERDSTGPAPAPGPSLEYEELTLEEGGDEGKPSDFEAEGFGEIPIELEEISLSEEPVGPSGKQKESELSFDLEDLDLELELEEESDEDKK